MQGKRSKYIRRFARVLFVLCVLLLLLIFLFRNIVIVKPPPIEDRSEALYERQVLSDSVYQVGTSWLRESHSGLWEMYTSGSPYEMGKINGILSRELVQFQEEAFVNLIKEKIPDAFYLRFLKYFIAWFNRDLDDYIPIEYQKEIYGISQSASKEYDFIGSNYQRILNYHAAHDIGHAMQNLNLVACTSFGVWDEYSSDSSLLIGRNFDFHAGDQFNENKIVLFVDPDQGYRFAMITWGGMIGAVSGMNEQGLTVTLNAAKSDIPSKAFTPVSIVARQILQYASTIDEAFDIAKDNKTFVSETFLIGSSNDHVVAIIEKSLDTTVLFRQNQNYILATNHFQDKAFKETKLNIENLGNETSLYRLNRLDELIHEQRPIDQFKAAQILRDRNGLGNEDIGLTNEKTINQLIAHHSVVFKPDKLLMWVSTNPYQLGSYVCYDLKQVFLKDRSPKPGDKIVSDKLRIPEDPFLYSNAYTNYLYFKDFVKKTKSGKFDKIESQDIDRLIDTNPEFYYTYVLAGDYYYSQQDHPKSLEFYNFALRKEISSKVEREIIEDKIRRLKDDTGN